MAKIETAMVFAAGLGTRMLPLTKNLPKPMVKVLGKPLIDYRLDKLAEYGIKRVVVNTFHLAQIIEDYLKNRKDMEIIISREELRLETGGGLLKALPHLGKKPFFVINSDVIWIDKGSPALQRLSESWDEKHMKILMLLQKTGKAIGYEGAGDFELQDDGQVSKNSGQNHPYVFSGIQIFSPSLLAGMELKPFSLSQIFRERRQENDNLEGMYGIEHNGQWLHIDSVKGIKRAEKILSEI